MFTYTLTQTHQDGPLTLYTLQYGDAAAQASVLRLPAGGQSILTIACNRGMLLCRLYDAAVAERCEVPAAIFGAATLEEMLTKSPLALTPQAEALGAKPEMTALELLALFS